MQKLSLRNKSFGRIGDGYAPVIDHDHFLGHSAFQFPWKKDLKKPAVNLQQRGEEFVLEIAVPGFAKDELSVSIQDDLLLVRGQKKHAEKMEDVHYILEEFDTESFERRFRLSPTIMEDRIRAKYENGVLRLFFYESPDEDLSLKRDIPLD